MQPNYPKTSVKPTARRYEYSVIKSGDKTYKQRKSFNIFGELTRTDHFPFETINAEINGKPVKLNICRWAGKDGSTKTGVKFDVVYGTEEQKNEIVTWAESIMHNATESDQLPGCLIIAPKSLADVNSNDTPF